MPDSSSPDWLQRDAGVRQGCARPHPTRFQSSGALARGEMPAMAGMLAEPARASHVYGFCLGAGLLADILYRHAKGWGRGD